MTMTFAIIVALIILGSLLYFACFRADSYTACRNNIENVKNALISYYYDHNTFPISVNKGPTALDQLTTPVPYILDGYLDDPFTKQYVQVSVYKNHETHVQDIHIQKRLQYYSAGNQCIIWSIAGNNVTDINITDDITITTDNITPYHPSNGISSNGDIYLIIKSFKNGKDTIDFNIERSFELIDN